MANLNKPQGLVPLSYLNGSPWSGAANLYSIAASYGTALYIGDPVISSGTSDSNGVQGIAIYGGTGAIRGVIVGLGKYEGGAMVNPSNLDVAYRPASDAAAWYALVVDDPFVCFEVQENGPVARQLAAADCGLNTVLKSGTGQVNVSGWQLSSYTDATPNTTSTLAIRLLGLVRKPGNAFGAYAKWKVKINVHELASDGITGV